MQFNRHHNLTGQPAPFSPSQSAWLRNDDDKAVRVYLKRKAAQMGTRLHAWAKETIDLGIKQPRSKKTIYAYVNDAIGYKMKPEQILYYSPNCFGTADAISFRDNFLRIHDFKSGVTPAKMEQLEIYAALFCLEYKVKPSSIEMELRLYQSNDIIYHNPTAEDILPIMDKIITFDKIITKMKSEEV